MPRRNRPLRDKPENPPEAILLTLCTRMQGVELFTETSHQLRANMADTTPVWERVRGMVPVSLCDWPGKITCVLFSGGCNLRCPTCHNASLAWNWASLPGLDKSAVLDDLRRRKRWLDGITLSGGEPTCVAGLEELLADLASTGLPVKLDSNGSAPHVLRRVLEAGLVQALAVDVKGPWAMYPELTGQGMAADTARDALAEVFALALAYPGQVYFRCTKVPDLTAADLEATRAQVPGDLSLHFQDYVEPRCHDDFS
jgi:pyruvate formate lyase activating enzyme